MPSAKRSLVWEATQLRRSVRQQTGVAANVYVTADTTALIAQPKTRRDRPRARLSTTFTYSGAIYCKDNR